MRAPAVLVDVGELAAHCSTSRGMISTMLQGPCGCRAGARSPCPSRPAPRRWSRAGRRRRCRPMTPAQARDCRVDRPTDSVADHVEHHREAVDLLVEQRLHRLGRHVAAGDAGAAGGDDASTAGSSTQAWIFCADRSMSSGTMARSASSWPAASTALGQIAARSVSLSSSRVSDTVRTAIPTGTKSRSPLRSSHRARSVHDPRRAARSSARRPARARLPEGRLGLQAVHQDNRPPRRRRGDAARRWPRTPSARPARSCRPVDDDDVVEREARRAVVRDLADRRLGEAGIGSSSSASTSAVAAHRCR